MSAYYTSNALSLTAWFKTTGEMKMTKKCYIQDKPNKDNYVCYCSHCEKITSYSTLYRVIIMGVGVGATCGEYMTLGYGRLLKTSKQMTVKSPSFISLYTGLSEITLLYNVQSQSPSLKSP